MNLAMIKMNHKIPTLLSLTQVVTLTGIERIFMSQHVYLDNFDINT